jgi:hypothetical protein
MKLSKEQIEKIDVILENLGLDFLDFKLEIKDHIATQTEDLCEKDNISFEEGLSKVLKEWESSLILKESIWISNKRSFSAIVLNAIKKRYIIYSFITLPLIVGISIFYLFNIKEFETIYIKNIMFILSTVLFLTLFSLHYFISLNKQQTSYSYEFNRIYKMALIFWFFDVVSYLIKEIYPIILSKAMIIAYVPIAIYSYIKHTQFKKHLNIF